MRPEGSPKQARLSPNPSIKAG